MCALAVAQTLKGQKDGINGSRDGLLRHNSCRSRHAPHRSPPQAAASSDPSAEVCPSPAQARWQKRRSPRININDAFCSQRRLRQRLRHSAAIHPARRRRRLSSETPLAPPPCTYIRHTKLAAARDRQRAAATAPIPHAARSPSNRGDDVHVRLGLGAADPYRYFCP
ncbi:hypothetical protein TPAR_05690 [Tolypocladium paradoxum]|uniref:Uncharacterized protein n=1 Tax=Tolypocladium paradoxum TaxID=94208 RepID=A0A2S4KV19_9HYPO|nr:hypothetical protein TPAR_05690 [Tolypocladium paradoxum]